MSETAQPVDAPVVGDGNPSRSMLFSARKVKFNGYLLGALAVAASAGFVYLKSAAPKPVMQPAVPQLTAAPRKPVPVLKPPLPELITPPGPPTGPPAGSPAPEAGPDPLALLRQQQEMQRAEKSRQLMEARLKSALDPGENSPGLLPAKVNSMEQSAARQGGSSILATELRQDPNSGFARAVSAQGVPSSQASGVALPEYKLLQGKVIEAILLPRIVSDLPGTVCALVQRDVYAERGRRILIPWGSRVCGVYNAELKKGQSRLFTVWNTLRVANPDGSLSSVALDSPGSDQLGSAGIGGQVDTHFAEIFGTAALLSIIGAGAANMAVEPDEQNYSAEQYRLSVQQAAARTAQSVLAPYVNIAPTVTVAPGTRIRILVNRDLDFSGLFEKQRETAHPGDHAKWFQ